MILKKLRIEFRDWGEFAGKYIGTAEFGGEHGEVALNLTPEHCAKIFDICADGILEVAKEAATNLRVSVIEQKEIRKLSEG